MQTHELEIKAREMLDKFGLPEWEFRFDRAVRRFGATHHGLKRITMSKALVELNTWEIVENTLLHEIAHALAGRNHGHSPHWKRIARSIGCDGERLYDSSVVKAPQKRVVGKCLNCGRVIRRHRRSRIACGTCCRRYNNGRYSNEFEIIWSKA